MTQNMLLILSIVCIGAPVYGIFTFAQVVMKKFLQSKMDENLEISKDDLKFYCMITFFRWASFFGVLCLSVNLLTSCRR